MILKIHRRYGRLGDGAGKFIPKPSFPESIDNRRGVIYFNVQVRTFPKLAAAPRSTFLEGVEGFLAGLEPFCFLTGGGSEAVALSPGFAHVRRSSLEFAEEKDEFIK